MANPDRPNGFRPVKTLSGAPWTNMIRQYPVADRSADTTGNHGDIYIGDPIKLTAGLALVANSGDTVVGVCVSRGTAAMHGEAGYVQPGNESDPPYSPLTNTTDVIGVVSAADVLFEVQSAIDLDLLPGSQADMTTAAATAHGSRTTGMSTVELTTASNNDVEVVENSRAIDNDPTLANARSLVQFVTRQHA